MIKKNSGCVCVEAETKMIPAHFIFSCCSQKPKKFFSSGLAVQTSSPSFKLNTFPIRNWEDFFFPPTPGQAQLNNSLDVYSRLSARPMVQKQTATMHPMFTGRLLDFTSMSRFERQRRVKILQPESEEPVAPAGTHPHKGLSVLATSGSRLQSQCLWLHRTSKKLHQAAASYWSHWSLPPTEISASVLVGRVALCQQPWCILGGIQPRNVGHLGSLLASRKTKDEHVCHL